VEITVPVKLCPACDHDTQAGSPCGAPIAQFGLNARTRLPDMRFAKCDCTDPCHEVTYRYG
jgi:hypothetical protein